MQPCTSSLIWLDIKVQVEHTTATQRKWRTGLNIHREHCIGTTEVLLNKSLYAPQEPCPALEAAWVKNQLAVPAVMCSCVYGRSPSSNGEPQIRNLMLKAGFTFSEYGWRSPLKARNVQVTLVIPKEKLHNSRVLNDFLINNPTSSSSFVGSPGGSPVTRVKSLLFVTCEHRTTWFCDS